MQISSGPSSRAAPSSGGKGAPDLQVFVYALFLIFGGITSLNDIIIPKLKGLFTLSYGEVMLVQSAFFGAYFLVSIPAAMVVKRLGYMRTAVVGLLAMMSGCLMFIPASRAGLFWVFLIALFVLAVGITTVQVVANPLISMLGPAKTASSRLTFAQAFNSLGTTIFPYVGSILILGSISKVDPRTLAGAALGAYRASEGRVIAYTYIGLAAALAIVAAVVWARRKRLVESPAEAVDLGQMLGLLRRPRFAFGAACIFLYVGAEVSVGSLIVSYLGQANVMGLGEQAAGKHVPLYWGGALVGRFIGAFVLRAVSAGKLLAFVAACAIGLLLLSANTVGPISGWALLSIGLFNAIMFPTIFSLACEGLGDRAAEGSGLICMAIVGGAIVPLITGHTADLTGRLRLALAVPAFCYAGIMAFGAFARRPLDAMDGTGSARAAA